MPCLAVGFNAEIYNLFTSSTRFIDGSGILGGVVISTTYPYK
jgi:hypothetical protein